MGLALWAVLGPIATAVWIMWLTRGDYAEGYRAGWFAAKHGMDHDPAYLEPVPPRHRKP